MSWMPTLYKQWGFGPPCSFRDLNCTVLVDADVNPGQFGLSLRWDRDTTGLSITAAIGPAEVRCSSPPIGPDRDEPAVEIGWNIAGRRITLFRSRRHLGLTTRWHPAPGSFRIEWFWMGLAYERWPDP